MRIAAAPVAPVVAKPVAPPPPRREEPRGFGEAMAQAEDATPEKEKTASEEKVTPSDGAQPVVQAPPPPFGGRAGVGGGGLVEPVPPSDAAAVPGGSVPDSGGIGDLFTPGLGPSPQPSPRGGEGVLVVPVAPLPVVPPVGVAEAAIREQVAALVGSDDIGDIDPDMPGVPVVVSSVSILSQAAASTGPALSADAALGLHVAVARHGQAMDGIARDIMAANGNGDGPVRFRLEPAALGAVMVEMARGQDGLAVRIEARDAAARDLIADQQPRLMTDARAAGVPIATVQVEARRDDMSSSSSYSQPSQQQADGQAGQPPPRPVPAWLPRAQPRAADPGAGPRATGELYA